MDDKIWDLTIVVISVLLAKALDEGIEALKKRPLVSPESTQRGQGRARGAASAVPC